MHWYERYISPLSLVAGFIADNLILLRRVDLLRSNLLLFFYLAIAAVGIVLINMIESGRIKKEWALSIAPLVPVVVQFAFGGLFSGFLSLYSRSAAYAVSWVFVVVLAAVLLGNERFTRFYTRFPFQIGVYFGVLFSFLIFFLPVVFHRIGPTMFIGSGIVSLVVISILLAVLLRLAPEIVKREQTRTARWIAIIYIVFNVLYFGGAIPPLPLALKDAGVYHKVLHVDTTYQLSYEPVPWYESYLNYNNVFHRAPGEQVYVWTAIFAPSGLSTTILHQWQKYDEAKGQWTTTNIAVFPIVGGRDGGYRGYSVGASVTPGLWRVNVITSYGQIIGRVAFTVEDVDTKVPLSQKIQ